MKDIRLSFNTEGDRKEALKMLSNNFFLHSLNDNSEEFVCKKRKEKTVVVMYLSGFEMYKEVFSISYAIPDNYIFEDNFMYHKAIQNLIKNAKLTKAEKRLITVVVQCNIVAYSNDGDTYYLEKRRYENQYSPETIAPWKKFQ